MNVADLSTAKNEDETLCLVINPKSAGGRTAKRLDDMKRAAERFFGSWSIQLTEGPGHASLLAAQAARDGADIIAAVGGDGTASEVVNGMIQNKEPIAPECAFSIVPAGTGSDLVKTLKIPLELDAAFQVLAHGDTRKSDLIHVEMVQEADGASVERICVNMAGFCSNGDVVARVNRSSKRLGGRMAFLTASLATALTYRPPRVSLEWTEFNGNQSDWEGDLLAGFLANGQFGGGGMWLGRGGSMQDGAIDGTFVPPVSTARLLFSMPKLYRGTIGSTQGVIETRLSRLSARSLGSDPVRIDIDGEQPGILPATFTVLEKMLLIRGLWGDILR